MIVAQLNVRLAEGGAASIALDIHRRQILSDLHSLYFYGYGKNGKISLSHHKYSEVYKTTSRFTALSNLLLYPYLNYDLFGSPLKKEEFFDFIKQSDNILHMHVLHSHFMNVGEFLKNIQHVKTVWTLHDHWVITGRCAFTDGCDRWKKNCYKCETLNNYPCVKVDRASTLIKDRRNMIDRFLYNGGILVSPSKHLAQVVNSVYGMNSCQVVNNGIDLDSEKMISSIFAEIKDKRDVNNKLKIAIVAHDLSYEAKTNSKLINKIANKFGNNIEIHIIGKNSPFIGESYINHGFIAEKSVLMKKISEVDAVLFTSVVDNYPLILCEALSLGVPVIATQSQAADEILSSVGSRCIDEEDILDLISTGKHAFYKIYPVQDRIALADISRCIFSGSKMVGLYRNIYDKL